MAVKKCCIENCNSCSIRSEDVGVTYHKFPKNVSLYEIWIEVTQYNFDKIDTTPYVCSRHFCKSDFQIYKDSKYVLKSDAVPSIFPWIVNDNKRDSNMEDAEGETKEVNNSKESDGDNLDDIRKYIEDEEVSPPSTSNKNIEGKDKDVDGKDFDERLAVASSMMDMIMNETEEQLSRKKDSHTSTNKNLNTGEKGTNSMALSVGSKVEAKDFGEYWHPAQIIEVDYEEMEVLVHYENAMKKHDEWISVSSPRLRPFTVDTVHSSTTVPIASAISENNTVVAAPKDKDIKEEPNPSTEDKPKLLFVVGERCLARWRDNRRFMATINNDLGNGHYEIVFDDGFRWTCTTSRLYKMKQPGKVESVDTSCGATTVPSPVQYGAGPSSSLPATPAYHTHLFDPTRDYLGSKSERREMKRKLNIKEIFNIGQKRPKKSESKDRIQRVKSRVEKKKKIVENEVKSPLSTPKSEVPDAVASIIGTIKDETDNQDIKDGIEESDKEDNITDNVEYVKDELKEDFKDELKEDFKDELKEDFKDESKEDIKDNYDENADLISIEDLNIDVTKPDSPLIDPVQEEELLLEKFDKDEESKHEEVIDRIKEVINKLEDGISRVESSKLDITKEIVKEEKKDPEIKIEVVEKEKIKKISKVKKSKKLRLLQEKKVKKQVEKVKCELEEMKKQVEEMRKQMLAKTQELAINRGQQEMPESFLLPGEWCCRWVNGQPVGKVSQLEGEVRDGNSKPGLPRRSVQVEDKRLPPGWTKHMVRRSLGNSAGKWDVVLVSPDNRRFHTKTDIRNYMEQNMDETICAYEHVLMDFGVHLKLARRMGWVSTTPGGVDNIPVVTLPAGTLTSTSPLVKRRKLSLKKEHKDKTKKKKKLSLKIRMPKYLNRKPAQEKQESNVGEPDPSLLPFESDFEVPPIEDGYVYVGSLKVQIIENLLRCPAEGCYKNFRNNTLIKMHIKHYHRELRKMLGRTPKVLDLAYARTMPTATESVKTREPELKIIKVKIPRPPKRVEEPKLELNEQKIETCEQEKPTTPTSFEEAIPKLQDSPKLRHALINKPVKRPRVLLPVRRPDAELEQIVNEMEIPPEIPASPTELQSIDILDFEKAISTHTVTKPLDFFSKKKEKKSKLAILRKKSVSEDEDWYNLTSDVETRSSFPRSGTPDSKNMDQKLLPISSESNEEQKESKMYMYNETGERIKIVHMKREEIINCHCGFREEDGLMVQCELCLCWQHALCHNIQRESEVPEKYTCSICLNPRRGRRTARFVHDQDRLYEGLLPGARPSEPLRRSHELSGNLHRVQDALHALRVKYYVATKKNHPKLYLWAKDWENGELNLTQEKLNSDYSDLNIIMSGIGKENLPVKPEELNNPHIDMHTSPTEDHDRYIQRDCHLGSQSLLSGLLASPGGASLDLPISTSELERLAKTVQEEVQRVSAPQPEAAIENGACRERLLRHIQRCQAVIDARLDSIEAQVAELESQDPSFEDDETADYFPRTKQTIQMLMRDLDTMEELGVIT